MVEKQEIDFSASLFHVFVSGPRLSEDKNSILGTGIEWLCDGKLPK